MYDLDEVTAWLDEQYIPWFNQATGGDAAKGGAHTDVGDIGPPPPTPPKKIGA